jgi:hypothetical protein
MNKYQFGKILLIIILISYIIYDEYFLNQEKKEIQENFTTLQALDAVKTNEEKLNNLIGYIDDHQVKYPKVSTFENDVHIEKKVNLPNGLNINELNMNKNNWKDYGLSLESGGGFGFSAPGPADVDISVDGSMYVDKDIKGNRLCIGETCIEEDHLKALTGKKHFYLKSFKGGFLSDDTNAFFQGNKKEHEQMNIEY